jgi:inhibitor of KinA sporulation pathway (predicted exonuclease)
MKPNILVFDVESTSLYGQAFAVGAIVLDSEGREIDSFQLIDEWAKTDVNEWVRDNVLPHLTDLPRCYGGLDFREQFYEFYCKHKDTADIWGDCIFPVEAHFLHAVACSDLKNREFAMPYPLKDISTIIDIDIDRAAASGFVGLRKHHPLDDARASARVLFNHLKEQK